MSVETLAPRASDATLREAVEALCAIERPPCSEGERQAAEWLSERLAAAGVDRVEVEHETGYGTFPKTMLALGVLAITGAWVALRGRRGLGAALAAACTVAFVDEVENGPRLFREHLRTKRKLQTLYWWTTGLYGPLEMSGKLFRLVRLCCERINQAHRRRSHIVVCVVERDACNDRWRRKLRRGEDDVNRWEFSSDQQPTAATIVCLELPILREFTIELRPRHLRVNKLVRNHRSAHSCL